jgi:hypothetical protein
VQPGKAISGNFTFVALDENKKKILDDIIRFKMITFHYENLLV